ncbi:MAG: S-layer homology domain-containing protein [Bryobacteraceae bacterium]|nr:S-layer homology domain-containing protein [Bryobacteraceae bacterium]MDW8379515.1 S-layer homology domain-containing protein [Bryobacterales bacterium]
MCYHSLLSRLSIFFFTGSLWAQELPSLFSTAVPDARQIQSVSSDRGFEVRRSRWVRLNWDAIRSVTSGVRRVQLDLFPDVQLVARETRSYWSHDQQTFLWHGEIEGMQRSQIVLAATGEIVSANISTDQGAFYQVRHVDGALHLLEQVDLQPTSPGDRGVAPPAEAATIAKDAERLASSRAERDTSGNTIIDVLVAYTTNARIQAGGTAAIQNRIQLAMAEVNQSFVNSGVHIQMVLVHMMEVAYDESSGIGLALTRLRDPGDGFMDEVHTERNNYGADLVSLWIHHLGPAPAGAVSLGYQMTTVSTAFAINAFSAVEQFWAPGPNYGFARGMGHNMGAALDRSTVGDTGGFGAYSYSHGYRFTGPNPFRTIMTVPCETVTCPVVNYWSNPDVTVNGQPAGIAANQPNSADNRLTLNNTRNTVANFRGTAGCNYVVSPTTISHTFAANTGTISVTAASSCVWYATTGESWITITSGASGSGSGSVNYSISANQNNAARQGTITVGGQNVTINQAANPNPTVTITIDTVPSGLSITVDGQAYSTPQIFTWVAGSSHTLSAGLQQSSTGTRHVFLSWSNGGSATQTIITPGVATSYIATYQTQHLLTLNSSPTNGGNVATSPFSPDGYYNAGTTVQLSAANASGFWFINWSGALGGSTNPAFVVMDAPKSVTANFSNTATTVQVTVTTAPAGLLVQVDGAQYTSPVSFTWVSGTTHTLNAPAQPSSATTRAVFQSWSQGGPASQTIIAPSTDTIYTAIYNTQFLLTTNITGGGTLQINPPSADNFYHAGSTVTLTAVPAVGGQFQNWTGSATGTQNPLAVVMDGPKNITANFTPGGNVVITSIPAGLQITVDGVVYTTPQSFTWPAGSSHVISAPQQIGTSPTRYIFANWSNGGPATQTIIAPATQTFFTATYITQHLLTTTVVGAGAIVADPPSADGFYPAGITVLLTANPAPGSTFVSWSGAVTGNANPVAVVMDGPRTVTANINTPPSPVTITSSPQGMLVQVDGVNYVTPQTFLWAVGSQHTLVAISPVNTVPGVRQNFVNWSQGGPIAQTITTPAAATTYTANYVTQYQLTAQVIPAGSGTIVANPVSPDGFYDAGTTVQLLANPAISFDFTGWAGSLTGNANPQNLQMVMPRAVTASFTPSPVCAYGIDHTEAFPPNSGDLRQVRVQTGPACNWTATANVPWVQITSGSTGTGNGTVLLTIQGNNTAAQRTGTVTIAGLTYTITQPSGQCNFQLQAPDGLVLPPAAAAYQINVTAAPGCQWTVQRRGDWLTLGTTSGAGNGSVAFNVTANTTAVPRTARVIIAGIVLHFVQKSPTLTQQYLDVPATHPFFDYIALLRLNNIPDTCEANAYCPETSITRSSMALFLVRTLLGSDNFTFPETPYFTDVPATHPYFRYIQKLRELGVTAGCTTTRFCPDDPVTRGQMAAFLVRARLGVRFDQSFPFSPVQRFQDVTPANIFFSYIQKLGELGLTTGCTPTQFCGDDVNSRGQMAAFLARGFF